MNTIFKNINDFHKSGKNLDFQKKFTFPLNQLDALVFFFFTGTTQNESRIIKYPPVQRR
jgi:hypothetical protein